MNYNNFFEKSKEKGIDNIQLTEYTNNIINVKYIDEKLDMNHSSFTVTYQIKAEKDNKTVKIETDYLDEKILDLLELKFKYTDTSYVDEYLTNKANNNTKNLNIPNLLKEKEEIKEIYKLKEKSEYIQKIESKITANTEKIRIMNANGVDMSTTNESYRINCEVLLDKDGTLTSYSKSLIKTNKEELHIKEFVMNMIKEAEKMVIKEEITTGKYDIIFSNEVTSAILSEIISATYANNIRQKISIFHGMLKQKIFKSNIQIIEDPTDKNLVGYALFDDEGTTTTKKYIVKDGILNTYLYNIKEAKLENKQSTGNSYEGIGTRNLYLLPGEYSKEALFKKMKNGLYITDFMGSQSTAINIRNGNISLQVFGFIIKNGKIKCGFIPCVMTTTIQDLFNSVESIGSDLEFFSKSSGSPSIYVKNISIAGK